MTKNTIISFDFNNKKQELNNFLVQKQQEKEKLSNDIIKCKNWLEFHPNKVKFLSDLLQNLQEPHIQFFNNLFTTLKHDILYSHLEDDELEQLANRVVFIPTFKNDRVGLKILAETPDGNHEIITSGGEKNVIITGLRVLALWRLISSENYQSNKSDFSHRNFLFLDEPDCWISNKALPHYINLLKQIVHEFDLQVMMVSHHNVNLFEPHAAVYKITHNGSFSDVQLIQTPDFSQYPERKNTLTTLELKNFKTLKSVSIDLSPYFTVLTGESMAGKSAIMEAFNAIINNQADDTVIRHHENKASVSLKINDYLLVWERTKKTSTDFPQKVRYRLYKNNELINEEYNSQSVPDFAQNVLKMRKVDDVDVHLASQDDVNFLFNMNETQRANILSLGKESQYIYQMMQKLAQQKRSYQSELKVYEKQYNKLVTILDNYQLSLIDPNNEISEKLALLEYDVQSALTDNELQAHFIQKLESIKQNQDSNKELLKKVYDNQKSIEKLLNNNLYDKLNKQEKYYASLSILESSNVKIIDDSLLNSILLNWQKSSNDLQNIGSKLKKWLILEKSHVMPIENGELEAILHKINQLPNLNNLIDIGKKLTVLEKEYQNSVAEEKMIKNIIEKADILHQLIIDVLPTCPTCGQSL